MNKIKLLVIDSEKNRRAWESMNEVVPIILNVYRGVVEDDASLFYFHVDELQKNDLNSFKKAALQSTHILVTVFNVKVANYLRYVRHTLGVDSPLIFYLHGLSTLGCWPYFETAIADCFKTSDLFFSTCSRDRDLFKNLVSPNASVHVVQYPLDLTSPDKRTSPHSNREGMVYIGRVSEQKNIHTLIYALWIIKRFNPTIQFHLDIFGKEDNYGSPNMGLDSIPYQKFLNTLISTLNLSSSITFRGFLPRQEIYDEIGGDHLFVSASLHSDENFGMAALRSLLHGANAVLSDWGGHADFHDSFPSTTSFVPVYKTPIGPVINPFELAMAIHHRLKNYTLARNHGKEPSHYDTQSMAKKIKQLLGHPCSNTGSLVYGKLSKLIWGQRKEYAKMMELNDRARTQQIFRSYRDPLAHQIFQSYGMTNELATNVKNAFAVPWVDFQNDIILINDPHRGFHKIPHNNKKTILVKQNEGETFISSDAYNYLLEHGYIFDDVFSKDE